MQSNHPCKEIVTLPRSLSSSTLSPLRINASRFVTIKNHRDNRDRSSAISLALRPLLSSVSLSRRFRSIKSASQFQPRVPPALHLYRFQPITFSRGSRIAVSGHVPIVSRELPFFAWTRYTSRSNQVKGPGFGRIVAIFRASVTDTGRGFDFFLPKMARKSGFFSQAVQSKESFMGGLPIEEETAITKRRFSSIIIYLSTRILRWTRDRLTSWRV